MKTHNGIESTVTDLKIYRKKTQENVQLNKVSTEASESVDLVNNSVKATLTMIWSKLNLHNFKIN